MIRTGNVDENDQPIYKKDYRDLITNDEDVQHIGLLVRSRKVGEKKMSDYNRLAHDLQLGAIQYKSTEGLRATEDPNLTTSAPQCNVASPRYTRQDGSVGAIQHGAQNIIGSSGDLDQD